MKKKHYLKRSCKFICPPKTKEGAKLLAFQLSAAIHSQFNKGDRIWFVEGHTSRYGLSQILRQLLDYWKIPDPYLTEYLHRDIEDTTQMTDEEYNRYYNKHYARELRIRKINGGHNKISSKQWGNNLYSRRDRNTIKN